MKFNHTEALLASCPERQPVARGERYQSLDLLRGFALSGVLLMNLLYFFREPLMAHMLAGAAPLWSTDWWAKHLVEFKAFALFAFSYGLGLGVQAERHPKPWWFLIRRQLVLALFGTAHIVLLANVDILLLYAVCGLLVLGMLRLPAPVLAGLGLAALLLPAPSGLALPPRTEWPGHVAAALQHYSHDGYGMLLRFRWEETRPYILPLLAGSVQWVCALMLLGIAAWKAGVVKERERWRVRLWIVVGVALLSVAGGFAILGEAVSLAGAYACLILAWRAPAWTAPIAAAGQMAFTNYLAQSFVFGLVFYGYGLGLFGKLASGPVAAGGMAFYLVQVAWSWWWLRRFRFGPMEWLWRSATYGRWQPFRLSAEGD